MKRGGGKEKEGLERRRKKTRRGFWLDKTMGKEGKKDHAGVLGGGSGLSRMPYRVKKKEIST